MWLTIPTEKNYYSKTFKIFTEQQNIHLLQKCSLNLGNIFVSEVSEDKITLFGIAGDSECVILYFYIPFDYNKSILRNAIPFLYTGELQMENILCTLLL